MLTVYHDSRTQPPISTCLQPWTLTLFMTGRPTSPRKIFLLQTVKLQQHNSRVAPPHHGTLVKSIRLTWSSLTAKKATKTEQTKTHDEQSEVRNGYEDRAKKSDHIDDEQCEVQHDQEAGADKTVTKITVIEQQGALLDFPL